jgi:hypothetical protein
MLIPLDVAHHSGNDLTHPPRRFDVAHDSEMISPAIPG